MLLFELMHCHANKLLGCLIGFVPKNRAGIFVYKPSSPPPDRQQRYTRPFPLDPLALPHDVERLRQQTVEMLADEAYEP